MAASVSPLDSHGHIEMEIVKVIFWDDNQLQVPFNSPQMIHVCGIFALS